mmetsp:Transcript_6723/g.7624  ORF Transcript_6723/g.7624 Transcript_6723/m.7624 type:complete len:389 (+) Transcript_6723:190-1356(+)
MAATAHWRQLTCSGDVPTGRIGHTLVTNTAEDTVYLYGGVNDSNEQNSQYLQDFFAFSFADKSWRQIEMSGEVQMPRAFHTAVFYNDQLHIFGGCNGRGRFNKLFSIDPTGRCSMFSPPPNAKVPLTRYCHSATLFEGKMYVFAGKCGGRNSNKRLKDMMAFDFATKTWIEVEQVGADVPARSAHAAFTCGRRMVMFGGRSSEGECCEDIYHFSYDTCMWQKIETNHGPLFGRARHSVVVHNGRVVIFGGWNGKKKLNDLIFYNMDSETSEVVHDPDETCPSRRECHVAVTCQNTMVVFGGRFRGNFMNDTCELDLGTKSLKDYCRDWLLQHAVLVGDSERTSLPRRIVDYMDKWRALVAPELQHRIPAPPSDSSPLMWIRSRMPSAR